jgi:proliferating cell nuclear antigen PCNA
MNIIITNKEKARGFTGIFQHLKLFCEHVNIMFEKNRVYAQGMDASHISIFELYIPSEWFDTYDHPGDGNIVIGLNVAMFFRILNTRDDVQEIHIGYNPDNEDTLQIDFSTKTKTSAFDKHFELPLIELSTDMMEIPTTDYQAEFSLDASNFANIVGQLKQFGSDLQIKCGEEEIRLISNSSESGNMSVVVPIDDLTMFAINEGETLHLSFSLSHLVNICAFHKVSSTINIKISDNYPLKAMYLLEKMADDEEDETTKARLVVYLAPRMTDE